MKVRQREKEGKGERKVGREKSMHVSVTGKRVLVDTKTCVCILACIHANAHAYMADGFLFLVCCCRANQKNGGKAIIFYSVDTESVEDAELLVQEVCMCVCVCVCVCACVCACVYIYIYIYTRA